MQLKSFSEVKELQSGVGFKPQPMSDGIHVHVDFKDPTTPELAILTDVFSSVD